MNCLLRVAVSVCCRDARYRRCFRQTVSRRLAVPKNPCRRRTEIEMQNNQNQQNNQNNQNNQNRNQQNEQNNQNRNQQNNKNNQNRNQQNQQNNR